VILTLRMLACSDASKQGEHKATKSASQVIILNDNSCVDDSRKTCAEGL